jgi:hypothetical protein
MAMTAGMSILGMAAHRRGDSPLSAQWQAPRRKTAESEGANRFFCRSATTAPSSGTLGRTFAFYSKNETVLPD